MSQPLTGNGGDGSSPGSPSGERFSPGAGTPENAYEHWHRYLWARAVCGGKRVLDVASGEGYGSFLLAGVARLVVGVDVSPAAVEHSRSEYSAENLEFLVGRAEALPTGPAAFDVVVSFETIEHLGEPEQSRFLAEVKRVLVPGGTLVVSTPDREAYAEELPEVNEFHQREFSPPEFRALLEGHFKHVRFLGQRIYSCVVSLADGRGDGSHRHRRAPARRDRPAGAPSGGERPEKGRVRGGDLLGRRAGARLPFAAPRYRPPRDP